MRRKTLIGDRRRAHQRPAGASAANSPDDAGASVVFTCGVVLLMALVAAVFWQKRSFGILNFDDDQYLDPLIRQGLTSPGPPERWAAASWRRYALVLLSFAAGLLSESMLVTLPVALLFLDWWPLGRMEGYSGEWGCEQAVEKRGRTDVRQRSLGELVVEKISLLARRPRSPLPLFIGRPHSAAGGSLGCVRGRAHGTGRVESAGLALVHLRLPKELGWSAALVAVLGLTWGGWWQTRHWQSSESLWRYTLSVTKDNAYAHANLASVLA